MIFASYIFFKYISSLSNLFIYLLIYLPTYFLPSSCAYIFFLSFCCWQFLWSCPTFYLSLKFFCAFSQFLYYLPQEFISGIHLSKEHALISWYFQLCNCFLFRRFKLTLSLFFCLGFSFGNFFKWRISLFVFVFLS